jgi:hypothetical protein
MALITEPHLDAPDPFYEALIEAHADLSVVQSHQLNAKLVLLLANHIGRFDVLRQALQAARDSTLASSLDQLREEVNLARKLAHKEP